MKSKDINGDVVFVGDRVRIISIDPVFLDGLPDDEKKCVRSMIGQTLEIEKIEGKYIYISQSWQFSDESYQFHTVCLAPNEIELVEKKDKK